MKIRRAILVACVLLSLLAVGLNACAEATLHVFCSTLTVTKPVYLDVPTTACLTSGSSNIGKVATENHISCNFGVINGAHDGGAHRFPCTASYTDDVSTVGPGHFYINCPDCPVEAQTGGFWVRLSDPTAANGGCLSQTVNGVADFVCQINLIRGCHYQGSLFPCSLAIRRSPDVAQVTESIWYAVMFFSTIAGLFLGWFMFGPKRRSVVEITG